MSHLFLIDESGNDRRQMPYEVHGGIVVPLSKAWDLIRSVKDAQARLFGSPWKAFEVELKGERLLQKRVFKFADGKSKHGPPPTFDSEEERRSCAHSFMKKGYDELLAKRDGRNITLPRTAKEFRAYGQACVELASEIFLECFKHHASILAVAVDKNAPRPEAPEWDEMLRKDLVYLFERLFYFMECHPRGAMAVCVFDQKDDFGNQKCVEGEKLNECISKYFTKTHTGRLRSLRILPEPLFARSDLTTLLGIADTAIYVINHVFRPNAQEWTQPIREELMPFVDWIYKLRWMGQREDESKISGIIHMSDLRPRGA